MSQDRVGRYELQSVLGSGGFATVYLATDPRLDALVAVKVLADNWSREPDMRRRFRNEAVLLRRVQQQGHVPGIVEVFDIDETDDGRPFLVMSYADRGTIADRCHGRVWPPADVLPVIDALAETVGALHHAGVVHRDLKPSNLLLRTDRNANRSSTGALVAAGERLVVGDLGLAKDLTSDATGLSLAGGSQWYMAPEQVDPSTTIDRRADVYAATVVVGRLLGAPLGEGEMAGRLLGGAEAPPSAHRPPSSALSAALGRGLAPDRADRYPSMDQWRTALRAALASPMEPTAAGFTECRQPSGDPSPPPAPPYQTVLGGPPPPPVTATPDHRRVGTWAVGGVAAVLGVLLLAAVVALSGILDSGGERSRIVGPDQVEVGRTVTYRADVDDGIDVTWTDWNGRRIVDQDLSVSAVLPGSLTFTLEADGQTTERTITVVEAPDGPVIRGPSQVSVGNSATFSASVPGGDRFYWINPAGVRVETRELTVVATDTGAVSIGLIAVDAGGTERGTRRTVEVAQ